MQHTWAAALACGTPRKRRRRRRYDLGTPPDGYEKTPGGGENSYRKALPGGGYDYWYDEGGEGRQAAQGQDQGEQLPDWTTNLGHYMVAPFEAGGSRFKFKAHQVTGGGPWELTFAQVADGNLVFKQEKLQDRMAALKVFGVVRKLAMKFVREKQPAQFKFSADLSEPARVRLYEKMAGKMAADTGYTLKVSTSDGKRVFLFAKAKAKAKSWWPWNRSAD